MKRPPARRPLVFAHRGANKLAPENTLPAFRKALDLCADGVELDVRYSSDGHLVIMHNPDLDATTNGQGKVSAHTLEELRRFDAGIKFGPEFAGTRIPTLDEALDLLAGRCLVNIEIKTDELNAGGIARDVVASVRGHAMADQVVISSFNPFALRPVKDAAPEIATAYLTAPDLPRWMRLALTRAYTRADGIHPHHEMVDENYMAWAQQRRLPVRVWTVDEEAEMRRMIALGVDTIVTNVPDRLLAVLNGG